MTDAVVDVGQEADALVSAAAISDYTMEREPEKIPSGQAELTLELTPTPKLIDSMREAHPDLPIVGFKLETDADDERLVSRARETQDRADLAFVVANDASVMGAERTRALIVDGDEHVEFEGEKRALGDRIAKELVAELI
jgi:phosphopantothenoylcysteine decarboxylase/phosphopantothenate--cysteine ligase